MPFQIALNTVQAPEVQAPAHLSDRTAKPLPQPTSTQQMHQLAAAGENTPQIAANLGLPVSTVDSTLGYTISTEPHSSTAQTSILVAGASVLTPPFDTKA